MSIRTASLLPSTFTCKLQAQYISHEPPPGSPTHPPNHWLDGTHVSGMLPAGDVNVKKPRVGGAEFGGTSTVTTAHAAPVDSWRLARPSRLRCDNHHKKALFFRVLQQMSAFMTR